MLTQDEFEQSGIQLGDSCDIEFGNGYTLTDVPYFNGYYTKTGEPLIVAYPGSEHVTITLNNTGLWDNAALTEGDSVRITLNEAGKYGTIQEALGQVYSSNKADYASTVEFCNYRALAGGNLKENFFFRGASPVDNSRGRAADVDDLIEAQGVAFILDLADTEENMSEHLAADGFDSPYAKALFENNQAALLGMSSAFASQEYKQHVADGFRAMLQSDGPVYIHCTEGKDRTGFVCTLLEALANASYDEMLADYMKTYENYYGVTKAETPEKFDAISSLYFDAFMEELLGTSDTSTYKDADYTQAAADYLQQGGMTAEEIEQLKAFIAK